jgi:hypothetical protein
VHIQKSLNAKVAFSGYAAKNRMPEKHNYADESRFKETMFNDKEPKIENSYN